MATLGVLAALAVGLLSSLARLPSAPPIPVDPPSVTPASPEGLLAGLAPRFSPLLDPPASPSGDIGKAGFDRWIFEAATFFRAPEGGASGLDLAILRLEAAAKEKPGSADVLSDLAGLYYLKARQWPQPAVALRALDLASQAGRLTPIVDANQQFNRGLYLAYLGLWRDAQSAWQETLRLSHSSGLAAEVTNLLSALDLSGRRSFQQKLPALAGAAQRGDEEQVLDLVSRSPLAARQYLEETLLPAWGEAQRAGLRGARAAQAGLRLAGAIADALFQLNGESLYREAVEAVHGAAGDKEKLEALADAHLAFGQGVARLQADAEEAFRLFAVAELAFERVGDPFAHLAALKRVTATLYLRRYREALRSFELLESSAAPGYHNERFELAWLSGLAHNSLGEFEKSAASYERALAIAQESDDPDGLAGIQNMRAERAAMLGALDESWEQLQTALFRAPSIESPLRLYQIYVNAAMSALRLHYPEVGLLFLDEALRQARDLGNPQALTEGYRWRASLDHEAGRHEEAARDLAAARKYLDQVASEQRRVAEMALQLVEGELAVDTDPAGAIAKLSGVVDFYTRDEFKATLAGAYAALGRAYAAQGDLEQAVLWLGKSADRLDSLRGSLSAARERVTFGREAELAFDALAGLELRGGRPEEALLALERKRGRPFLDLLAGVEASPLGADELRAALPADRAIVEYAAVDGKMGAWVLHRDTFEWIDLAVSEKDLGELAEGFTGLLRVDASLDELRGPGSALYVRLIQPLLPHLPADAALVLVADGPLANFPFVALLDGRTGHFLIEDRALAFAPSANVYVRQLARDRGLLAERNPCALILGNPRLGPEERFLPKLSKAEDEAQQVGALYSGTRPLLGGEATKEAFLTQAGACEVVHFAGHAVANLDAPGSSKLLFSPVAGEPGSGELLAREIGRQSFPATRLLVLGGCSTAGSSATGEGLDSLASPFLAAGIPGVVGSLWRVEDAPTAELLIAFHRGLAAGRDALHALQEAQISLLHSGQRALTLPSGWAAFRLLGDASAPSFALFKG